MMKKLKLWTPSPYINQHFIAKQTREDKNIP